MKGAPPGNFSGHRPIHLCILLKSWYGHNKTGAPRARFFLGIDSGALPRLISGNLSRIENLTHTYAIAHFREGYSAKRKPRTLAPLKFAEIAEQCAALVLSRRLCRGGWNGTGCGGRAWGTGCGVGVQGGACGGSGFFVFAILGCLLVFFFLSFLALLSCVLRLLFCCVPVFSSLFVFSWFVLLCFWFIGLLLSSCLFLSLGEILLLGRVFCLLILFFVFLVQVVYMSLEREDSFVKVIVADALAKWGMGP